MKKTAIAAALMMSTGAAQAATYDVLGGTFFMLGVSAAPESITGIGSWTEGSAAFDGSAATAPPGATGWVADPTAGQSGLDEFPFFNFTGDPAKMVRTYFAPTGIDGGSHAGPTINCIGAGCADMSSFYAHWNGTEFNQGAIATVADDGDGTLTLVWSSLIVGGPFDGFTGDWTMHVKEQVIPVPAAVWLFGSGLLGLVGVARRRKSS